MLRGASLYQGPPGERLPGCPAGASWRRCVAVPAPRPGRPLPAARRKKENKKQAPIQVECSRTLLSKYSRETPDLLNVTISMDYLDVPGTPGPNVPYDEQVTYK